MAHDRESNVRPERAPRSGRAARRRS
jgi:hypothetical protein